MKTRILSLALALLLVLACVPAVTANAGYTEIVPPKYDDVYPSWISF
ncbi:MAG: hypothetical protein FWG93_04150 [Oscillospiraceae bacterium]|nr:hypothetical protein [Oscillospiraceae bacterium]